MPLDLPAPLSTYFEAQNAHDIDAMLATFADAATVRDEKQDLSGHAAIRAWIAETTRKYRHTATPITIAEADGKKIVTARVAGTFPGSPIDLRYRFTITAQKISGLEIG